MCLYTCRAISRVSLSLICRTCHDLLSHASILPASLIPEPLTLVGHFFAVAFYGVYLCLTNQLESKIAIEDNKADTRNTASKALDAVVELPHNLHRSMMAIWTACVVIFPVIFAEMKS